MLYLSAELYEQLGRVGAVGSQAAHRRAEVGQTGDGFAGLGGSAGSFVLTRAGCRAGGEASATCRCQAHQPDQSPDVGQTQRLQTGCQAAARATVREIKEEGGTGEGSHSLF